MLAVFGMYQHQNGSRCHNRQEFLRDVYMLRFHNTSCSATAHGGQLPVMGMLFWHQRCRNYSSCFITPSTAEYAPSHRDLLPLTYSVPSSFIKSPPHRRWVQGYNNLSVWLSITLRVAVADRFTSMKLQGIWPERLSSLPSSLTPF